MITHLDRNYTVCLVLSDGLDELFREIGEELDLYRVKTP